MSALRSSKNSRARGQFNALRGLTSSRVTAARAHTLPTIPTRALGTPPPPSNRGHRQRCTSRRISAPLRSRASTRGPGRTRRRDHMTRCARGDLRPGRRPCRRRTRRNTLVQKDTRSRRRPRPSSRTASNSRLRCKDRSRDRRGPRTRTSPSNRRRRPGNRANDTRLAPWEASHRASQGDNRCALHKAAPGSPRPLARSAQRRRRDPDSSPHLRRSSDR